MLRDGARVAQVVRGRNPSTSTLAFTTRSTDNRSVTGWLHPCGCAARNASTNSVRRLAGHAAASVAGIACADGAWEAGSLAGIPSIRQVSSGRWA